MAPNLVDDAQANAVRPSRSFWRPGLQKTLLLWLLFLSLLPLVIVSALSYRSAYEGLKDSAQGSLSSQSKLKTEFVQYYFARMLADVEHESQLSQNALFLGKLRSGLAASGERVGEFVKSFEWATIIDESDVDLRESRRTRGYHDILLVDADGNVLFSVAREGDLGANLFTGKYSDTLIGRTCRECLETGRTAFSDLEVYAPSRGRIAGFIASVIVDDEGEKIGLLVFQVDMAQIDEIMQDRDGLGATGETYLVGADLRMRSNSALDDKPTILRDPVDTELTRHWYGEHVAGGETGQDDDEDTLRTYRGRHGRSVIGIHRHIEVAGVSWAVVMEMEEAEAFASAHQLRAIFVGLLLGTGAIVFLTAVLIAGRIVRPIRQLSRGTKLVAGGELDHEIRVSATNEISDLSHDFNNMVDDLRRTRDAIKREDWLKTGQAELNDEIRGEGDLADLARRIVTYLARYIGVPIGALYVADGKGQLRLAGSYAFRARKSLSNRIELGEGLVGQAALEKTSILLTNVPDDYLAVASGLGQAAPKTIMVMPFMHNGEVKGVVELGSLNGFPDATQSLLGRVSESIAVSIHATQSRQQVQALLKKTQEQAEELRLTQCSIDKNTNAVFWLRPDGEFCYVNDAACTSLGYSREELLRMSVPDIDMAVPRENWHEVFGKIKQAEGVMLEGRLRRKDGTIFPGEVSANFLAFEGSEYVFAFVADITERKQSEEELRQINEELQAQQEELRQSNEELEEQTRALRESEERLQGQQEELRQMNEELEERTEALEAERNEVKRKNAELEEAQGMIEEKAEDLARTSQFKSEFLANVSHELRTPLNSLLILSQLLRDNKDGNLTEKQVEYARTINSSGSELLSLINEILDLSKIESGKMTLVVEDAPLADFVAGVEGQFRHVAEEKGLEFRAEVASGAPSHVQTDSQRLGQVVKNLLSNAFKFTSEGSVSLTIDRPELGAEPSWAGLDPGQAIAVTVADTGIGIPEDKQKLIFEAFQQADGTTVRRYGGTGLGLAISRELVSLLGGEIRMASEVGKGSSFTVLLPDVLPAQEADGEHPQAVDAVDEPEGPTTAEPAPTDDVPLLAEEARAPEPPLAGIEGVLDDRREIEPNDRSILIIEDDSVFARMLVDQAHERGFKCLVAGEGTPALHLADYYRPSGILLDLGLPDIDGMAVIDRLKENLDTRHIPVHIISGHEKQIDAMKMGAAGFMRKPISLDQIDRVFGKIESLTSRRVRTLLLVEDDESTRQSVVELIGEDDVDITAVPTGAEALECLAEAQFDCMVLDLALPDMSGVDLLGQIRVADDMSHVPVVVFTGRELSKEETLVLDKYAERIVVKDARSPERLLDETALFLHRVEKDLPEHKRRMIRMLHDKEAIFSDKKILLVDDDMRNVFALSSVLEEQGVELSIAKNGREGLERLGQNGEVHLVLMDIMMPEMDGYEAMREIRKQSRFKSLPIIALTAKAMKGDRAKCIEAGASDYLAKPVDTEKLLSMLRVWLYQ